MVKGPAADMAERRAVIVQSGGHRTDNLRVLGSSLGSTQLFLQKCFPQRLNTWLQTEVSVWSWWRSL